MRRKDREITDKALIEDFLSRQTIIRIGFYDKGEIYIVPVNYGFVCENGEYIFYFHGAKAGRKYELAQAEPEVGFEFDGDHLILRGDKACSYSAKYQSVIGTGVLSVVNSMDEKIKGLNCLMKQSESERAWAFSEKALGSVAVFRLCVKNLSCKANILSNN